MDNGHGDQPALIYDSPVTGTKAALTFTELRDETARFAGALAGLGITKGDRVVIYMPMIPEAVIAMLACARLGAVHSVVFGGFAAHELAVRIDDAKPRLIVSASCGIEVARVIEYKPILDAAIDEAAHKPEHTIIVQRPQATAAMRETDLDWHDLMAADPAPAACVPVDATDPLYILYTSGTTGKPKGVVRDNGGPRGRARLVDAQHLRHAPGRGVLGRLGHRLGRRPLLHRLRAAAGRLHHDPLRGQAGRHP